MRYYLSGGAAQYKITKIHNVIHKFLEGKIMYTREEIIEAYTQAVRQCDKILKDVDSKFQTYGEIEVDNIVTTEASYSPLGSPIPLYTRKLEWRRILVQ